MRNIAIERDMEIERLQVLLEGADREIRYLMGELDEIASRQSSTMIKVYSKVEAEVSPSVYSPETLRVRLEPLYFTYHTSDLELLDARNSALMRRKIIEQMSWAFAEKIYEAFRPIK